MSQFQQSFPSLRMRRLRQSTWARRMMQETHLASADLIWPIFITDGTNEKQAISAMPNVYRLSIDLAVKAAKQAVAEGIPCLALFPNTPQEKRDDDGSEALNADNLICRATRAIKDAVPDIGIMCDVALDPYTAHGHDGLVEDGEILNDETVEILVKQSLIQVAAGCDIIAPSDMMDGRIAAIRDELEMSGHSNTLIMAYAAKYASAFYEPFRAAVGSGAKLKGDKKSYQMNPANTEEALREVALDLNEGADMVMVKPGLPYLDVIQSVKQNFGVPTFAYQVSGEYAMLQAAIDAEMLSAEAAIMETLGAFKRAGADGILTYYALQAARILNG